MRRKHIPVRTCIGCKGVLPKRSMTRIVRTADGVFIDQTGKLSGRGAYIHDKRSCWEIALRGALNRALKIELSNDEREGLRKHMSSISDDEVLE